MSAQPNASIAALSAPSRGRVRSWAMAVGGMVAAGCAGFVVYVVAAAPANLLVGVTWHQAVSARQPLLAFDSRTPLTHPQVLRGVSGEANAAEPADEAALTPAAALAASDLSLLALDRVSAGDCISLTTASGHKLSFRILGAHSAEEASKAAASSSIDLAVAPCAANGEAIRKAVIESKAGAKENAVQRNL
jgi:hypothetical protein